jgi:cytidyltransferase-like protein
MKIIITSLYGNPIHPGHIEYLEESKGLGDKLVVIVNNDYQQMLKIGKIFQNSDFRLKIIQSIKCVDEVFLSIDQDPSVCASIELFVNSQRQITPNAEFIFAKGGDRFIGKIPEVETCDRLGIKIIDGLGEKIFSSTDYRV